MSETFPGDSERRTLLLSRLLDRYLGGTPEVRNNRKLTTFLRDCMANSGDNYSEIFSGGSKSDGFLMKGSDVDKMYTDKHVVVMYPEQPIPPDSAHCKTIMYLRKADHCRAGYATLEVLQVGLTYDQAMLNSLVPVGNSVFVSSDVYRDQHVKRDCLHGIQSESNGPCSTIYTKANSFDNARGFHCITWPREAKEWITRHRSYGWPTQTLVDKIVQDGCDVVAVGDKCSDDTFLQWRISLVKAERRLVHSFNQVQFKTYGLLKYMLKQMKTTLQEIVGDEDILCSYFMKTLMFTAIENSHKMFWQDKNLFYCFWFCFNILIAYVKAGYFPNYFIPANNMFQRKVHGLNQLKLFQILHDVYQMKWKCLSIGTYFSPTIWELLCSSKTQYQLLGGLSPQVLEMLCDKNTTCLMLEIEAVSMSKVYMAMSLLSRSRSDDEEAIMYCNAVISLSSSAMQLYRDHTVASGNKTRYTSLRKCKRWLSPRTSLGTDLLFMATFHYQTGNYQKALELCRLVMSSVWYYCVDITWPQHQQNRYLKECCGQGHTLMYKLMNFFAFDVSMSRCKLDFCPSQLHPEVLKCPLRVFIPPLPYAVFLSFLSYHKLGDARGRDAALRDLTMWKDDKQQGGGTQTHWIVHTLLGICYQTVGDNRRAIRSYWDSLRVDTQWNPALDRIAVVYLVMYYQTLSAV